MSRQVASQHAACTMTGGAIGLGSLLTTLQRPGPMLVGIVILALLLLLLSHERAQHSHSLHLASVGASSGHGARSALESEPPAAPAGQQLSALAGWQDLMTCQPCVSSACGLRQCAWQS